MNIHGFTKTTLLDYPGLVACSVFSAGCNFRCPFCHNYELVANPDIYPRISEDEVFSHLEKRRGIISGICITGGEPTLSPDLLTFLEKLREYDIRIKLDTNGYKPDVMSTAISNGLVDYIAMDIKSSQANYSLAAGIPVDISLIEKSVEILATSNVNYEFRTTCVKGVHTDKDFYDIANWLPGDCSYFLQSYKENDVVPDKNCSSFSKDMLVHFKEILLPKVPNTSLRGID